MIRENNAANRIKDFFVKPPDPKELVRKWQTDLRKEQRSLERTIREIQRSEKEAKKMVTESAKRGDMASAKVSFAPKQHVPVKICSPAHVYAYKSSYLPETARLPCLMQVNQDCLLSYQPDSHTQYIAASGFV